VRGAERLILPGVGAFGHAIGELRVRKLADPIVDFCASGRPFLGICIGMQVMLSESTELGDHRGLGLIAGVVDRLPSTTDSGVRLRVPNIGWSELEPPSADRPGRWEGGLLSGIEPGRSALYFVHSYSARPADPSDVLAEVEFGGYRLVAAIERDNLTGVQFHPERSGMAGQKVLKRFLES
jgi:glutamine amidotransferase